MLCFLRKVIPGINSFSINKCSSGGKKGFPLEAFVILDVEGIGFLFNEGAYRIIHCWY